MLREQQKAGSYSIPERNRFFEVMCGVIREWTSGIDMPIFFEVIDFSTIEGQRESIRRTGRRPPTYTAFFVKAISLALREHPVMNRLVIDHLFSRRLVQLNEVHAAVAVERQDDGADMAYSTILRHSDRMSLEAMTATLRGVATLDPENDATWRKFRWMVRHLPPRLTRLIVGLPRFFPSMWVKHRGGSFLITSPAKYGVEAILVRSSWPLAFAFGQVKQRPMVVGGRVEARPTCSLSMGFDRRLAPGAPAAKFFHEIVRRLETADLEEELPETRPAERPVPAVMGAN